jgi:Tol biopolymer transport system component
VRVLSGAPRRIAAAAALAAAAGALAMPAAAARDDLDLVSRATSGAPADGASAAPSLSADGRYVAFSSDADNLASPQLSGTTDVFVRDLQAGTTALVSRAGPPADGISFEPSISADGARVAFTSEATNLSDDDGDLSDVFVRDLAAGTTELASRPDGTAGDGADDVSNAPAISADGRRVAFVSDADDLAPGAVAGVTSVYVRDLDQDTTVLVSRAPGGAGADGNSSAPAISADGSRVAFLSSAENLSTEDAPGTQDVYVRDLGAGTTTLASRASGASGAAATGLSQAASISADGSRVAFATASPNLSDEDADGTTDVFVRDLAAGTTILASRASGATGAGGDAGAFDPALSGDGLSVAFRSAAANLSAEDADPVIDVFVRDLDAGTTTLVSRAAGPAGAAAVSASGEPALSASGRYVAFSSGADNLSTADLDAVVNVFRRDVRGVPVSQAAPPAAAPAIAASPAARRRARARCAGRLATIVGTARRDVIRGTRRADVIAALGGDDVVMGAAGNDIICLGAGNDRAHAGRGADLVRGGPGQDLMLGGAGPDLLIGGGGLDLARGGHGADLCRADAGRSC